MSGFWRRLIALTRKETRQLVHARATLPDDVTGQPVAPSMWLQAAGPLRMRLDQGTEWYR